jgi:hypothetical protein
MADLSTKKTNFISRASAAGVIALANIEELREMLREATVLDYATALTDADFVGENDHLTKADLVAEFATINAIVALLEANANAHYANLYRLLR